MVEFLAGIIVAYFVGLAIFVVLTTIFGAYTTLSQKDEKPKTSEIQD